MKTYDVKLKDRRWVAHQTAAVRIERPSGYDYEAGQFARVKIDGKSHVFTLASAPHEEDLMFVTRMRDSAFKNALGALEPGSAVDIGASEGDFTLHAGDRTIVFVAGGIGVTPVRSMVLDAVQKNRPERLYFFYMNHRREDAAFLDELHRAEKASPKFTMIPTMTQPESSEKPWDGETGHVDARMIQKYVPNLNEPRYYVCGPPEMVDATESMLERAGVPAERIQVEHFSGY